jgi:O-antigen/teichoic acid export membrane protein
MKQGTQLFSLEFSEFMLMQGTIWMATAAFSSVGATQYAVAVTLGMQVTVLEALISLAITPPAARLWAAGEHAQVTRMLSNAATLTATAIFGVVALLALAGPFVLQMAYGESMRPAAAMLLILAAGGAVAAIFTVNITIQIVSGNIAATARTAVIVLCVTLPCAVAAAWLGHPLILAIVTSLGIVAMGVFQWLTARKTIGVAPLAHFRVLQAFRELRADTGDDQEVAPPQVEVGRVN